MRVELIFSMKEEEEDRQGGKGGGTDAIEGAATHCKIW